MEDVKPIEDFPEYLIARDGSIYTARNGALRRSSLTKEGAVKISLYSGGLSYTKSVALLVAQAWLYNNWDPEIFDTPIHLDNDLTNNHVDNLAWRPRWFAIKYQKQYWKSEYRHANPVIEDLQTGEIFKSLVEPCQRFGLLYVDLIKSCVDGSEVFPTRKVFRFVE